MKNIFKTTCLLALVGMASTSCQDWLTVYPQDKVVEENFWEDKNDLEGVRYAAYKQMCSTLEKMVLWGDLRSDSYTLSSADESTSTAQLYQEIREGKIDRDSASTYFEWGGFYTTINYCNKVLQHGPEVLEKDKQFTSSEWNQMKAEITTLRALNYFYLLRSFKDVPYSTKVINNDTQVESFSATNQLAVLDSLITDVESVKGQARNRFSDKKDTKGLITNAAIYALLSDMYLWRASLHEGRYGKNSTDTIWIKNNINKNLVSGLVESGDSLYAVHTVIGDYQLAADYADQAMKKLVDQTADAYTGFGKNEEEKLTFGLPNVSMYKNNYESFLSGNRPKLPAFEAIFSQGNSDESIFELQFNNSDSRSNSVVTSQWGYGNAVHLSVSQGALSAVYQSTNERYRDSRIWFSAWDRVTNNTNSLPGYYCFKWNYRGMEMPDDNKCARIKINYENDSYRNWIIYRLSDVMLQKAEALVALGKEKEAMKYVNAIHRRWYCNDSESVTGLPAEDVNNSYGEQLVSGEPNANTLGNAPAPTQNSKDYEIAVLNERQIEFLGEGKRWFDLVRYAERHAGGQDGTQDPREWTEENPVGNGKAGVDKMIDTFMKNEYTNVYKNQKTRFKNRYGLYNIIYYMEIKASEGKLEQNPVWNKSTYEL